MRYISDVVFVAVSMASMFIKGAMYATGAYIAIHVLKKCFGI